MTSRGSDGCWHRPGCGRSLTVFGGTRIVDMLVDKQLPRMS
jgi:hypothetical protein